MRYPNKRVSNARRAAVSVELALTIGLAFFFFFAALEFSRVSMLRHTMEHAVYEGARQAVIPGGTASDVENEVQRILRTVGVRTSQTVVNPSEIALSTPEVEVSLEVPLDGNLYFSPFFFKDRTLTRSITLQRETQLNNR